MESLASAIEAATGASASELAPAKINLALHVGGERPDGYHDLESLVVFADLGDVITARPVPAGTTPTLDLAGPFGGVLQATTPPENNLTLRAVEALIAALPRKKAKPVQLTLTKRLPIASGLGGGSADAAATLRLLARIWDVELPPRKLDARHDRHREVRDHQRGFLLAEQGDRLGPRSGGQNPEARRLQRAAQDSQAGSLVVNEEDRWHALVVDRADALGFHPSKRARRTCAPDVSGPPTPRPPRPASRPAHRAAPRSGRARTPRATGSS